MGYSHAMNLAHFNKQVAEAKQTWELSDGSTFFGTHAEAEAEEARKAEVPHHLTAEGFFEAQKRSNDEGYY